MFSRHGPWHRWFAWHPVNTTLHGWRWMRFVLRRRAWKPLHLPGPFIRWWDYTLPEGLADDD